MVSPSAKALLGDFNCHVGVLTFPYFTIPSFDRTKSKSILWLILNLPLRHVRV